jgi:cytochrome c oxidase assembly protein subunit 15
MADKYWPTHPLHLAHADLVAEAERHGYAVHLYVLEHSHRAAGWLVGLMSIVLCGWLWFADRRTWMKWLGTVALVGVIIQGVLGGMRVLFHTQYGIDLATIHGSFSHLVFALIVALALFTSNWWNEPSRLARSTRLRKLTLGVSLTVYLQVVFGAIVRHSHTRLAQRLHLLLAFAVLGLVLWLIIQLREEEILEKRIRLLGRVLMVALTFQIMLGVEAWMMRFGMYTVPENVPYTLGSSIVRTLHFIVGTVLFSSTVVLALLARHTGTQPASITPPKREGVLEAVA